MSFFGPNPYTHTCGAIIDIGSGSVGVAIIVSDPQRQKLDVIWSYREYMLIRNDQKTEMLLKEITTTAMNAMLELGSNGLKALHAYGKDLSLEQLQVAICAPWSYTVTKTINYKDDKEFVVTRELIEELVNTARKETATKLLDGKLVEDLGLRIISEATVQAKLNGYAIEKPIGNVCKSVTLSHIHSVAQEKIVATIEESHNKLLPKTNVTMYSFMYLYYQVLTHLYPDTSEVCLVDITDEATEIGIVRADLLQHTAHAPFGISTIARMIAQECSIPNEEALSLIKDENDGIMQNYGQTQQESIKRILQSYEETITKLFNDTGDSLLIPRSLFIHTSRNTESFFSTHIKNAAKKTTDSAHSVHLLTSELLESHDMNDSALALSAHFFHTQKIYITPIIYK